MNAGRTQLNRRGRKTAEDFLEQASMENRKEGDRLLPIADDLLEYRG